MSARVLKSTLHYCICTCRIAFSTTPTGDTKALSDSKPAAKTNSRGIKGKKEENPLKLPPYSYKNYSPRPARVLIRHEEKES